MKIVIQITSCPQFITQLRNIAHLQGKKLLIQIEKLPKIQVHKFYQHFSSFITIFIASSKIKNASAANTFPPNRNAFIKCK